MEFREYNVNFTRPSSETDGQMVSPSCKLLSFVSYRISEEQLRMNTRQEIKYNGELNMFLKSSKFHILLTHLNKR